MALSLNVKVISDAIFGILYFYYINGGEQILKETVKMTLENL